MSVSEYINGSASKYILHSKSSETIFYEGKNEFNKTFLFSVQHNHLLFLYKFCCADAAAVTTLKTPFGKQLSEPY